MPIMVTIDPDSGVVRLRTQGDPSATELEVCRNRIAEEAPRPLRLIDDRRGISRFRKSDEVREESDFVASRADVLKGAKIAVVVPELASYGMARMFQAYTDGQPFEMKAFFEIEEAEAWIEDALLEPR